MAKYTDTLLRIFLAAVFLLPAAPVCAGESSYPNPATYISLDLDAPQQTRSLVLRVSREQSLAYHWHAGQKIVIQAYVEDEDNQKHYLRDLKGRRSWALALDNDLSGSIEIRPSLNNFSGRLTVTGDGKMIAAPTPYLSETLSFTLEKTYERRFRDGAGVRVHFTDQILKEAQASQDFPRQVLDAAVIAYQTITQYEGFNSPGFSFSNPDPQYAYDPDKTLDVYLGNPAPENMFKFHGFSGQTFRDAPCFDTVKISERAFESVILLPANYRQFIQNWERLNPSSLGPRNINVDLRGTLMHEMLHAVIFYYNKNLNRETGESPAAGPATRKKNLDWYVEGLARYFETFAGARHDFFSQGFRETLPDKIRFSRGGSNYYMRYPDQPFTELRYENALFWRFIDYQYGMKAIEALSRSFREAKPNGFGRALEEATHTPFRELLRKFALASLLNDFGLKEDASNLKEVAKTRLFYENRSFYLLDGYDHKKKLGAVCRTDWVGRWSDLKAHLEDLPVGGDNTAASDVSAWATDYYEINLSAERPELPTFKVSGDAEGEGLLVQLVLKTCGGSVVVRDWNERAGSQSRVVHVERLAAEENLDAAHLEKIYLLVTNLNPEKSANYEIALA